MVFREMDFNWEDLGNKTRTILNRSNLIPNIVKLRLINNISPKIYKHIGIDLLFTIPIKKVIL